MEGYIFTNISRFVNYVIPLDENNAPDISNSIRGRHDLISKISDENLKAAAENGAFLTELLLYVEDNPFIFEDDFIHSDNLKTIIEQSPYVLEIEINKEEGYWNYKYCYCTVTKVYKGEDKFGENEKIGIKLPYYEVQAGGKYLILVADHGENDIDFYRLKLSSRHSVYDVSDTSKIQEIMEILDKSNK